MVIIIIVTLITGLILISVAVSWGGSSGGLINDFFNWITGNTQQARATEPAAPAKIANKQYPLPV